MLHVDSFMVDGRSEPNKSALRGSGQGNTTQRENIEIQAMVDTGLEPVISRV